MRRFFPSVRPSARLFSAILLMLVGAAGGCEGCPFFPPAPQCTEDADCPEDDAICEDGVCLAPGPADAGDTDAERDAGAIDAGIVDAGEDAGLTDAGLLDAGAADGGALDAGDGGGRQDAGSEDAGAKDAGPIDAGPEERTCRATSDCDFERVCAELRDEGDVVTPYCWSEGLGAGDLGDACTGGGDCASRLCLPRAQVCSEVCLDAATDCSADAVCTAYPFGATNGFSFVSVCALSCDRDADCPAERVCTYNGNPVTNVFDGVCEGAAGVGSLGDACLSGGDCASGLCLAEGCSRPCAAAADCEGGSAGNPMNTCSDVIVADPNDTGATQTLRMCR